jgi:ABC-type glycerol-3-phosphate transport system substrate-binding protein
MFANGYWCVVALVVLAVCTRLANASSPTKSTSLATDLPVTYFLPKYSADDQWTYVPLLDQCLGNEKMLVTRVANEISYDVDLAATTTLQTNNVQIVCCSNNKVNTRRIVLEIECKDKSHRLHLSRARHRSPGKLFWLCKPPR